MEITNEIKVKVFAQYWPCKYNNGIDDESRALHLPSIDTLVYCKISEPKLILKPLSAITDEDAIEVAIMEGMVNAVVRRNKFKVILQDDSYTMYMNFSGQITIYKHKDPFNLVKPFAIYQYLQSKGYDLPNIHLNNQTLEQAGLAIYQ